VEGFAAGHAPARARTVNLPPPIKAMPAKAIRALRIQLGCTQMEFAALLNIPKVTAISWENGTRKPSGAALRLLALGKHHPEALQPAKQAGRRRLCAWRRRLGLPHTEYEYRSPRRWSAHRDIRGSFGADESAVSKVASTASNFTRAVTNAAGAALMVEKVPCTCPPVSPSRIFFSDPSFFWDYISPPELSPAPAIHSESTRLPPEQHHPPESLEIYPSQHCAQWQRVASLGQLRFRLPSTGE
jgi:DNA-binding transcriptional regulator YiaG